jgi:quinol monooxygenase YgiN
LSKAQAYAESDAEPGCLQYRISVDSKNKNNVCVFEVYVRHPRLPTLLP